MPQPSEQIVDNLHKALIESKNRPIPRLIAQLLCQRGIYSLQEAQLFINPELKTFLYDPFLYNDMQKAVERLDKAISQNQKIMIWGDYDVDGTTATSLMYRFLINKTKNLEYYIPDRFTEGYGISKKGLDYAIEQKFDLIISVDCGIRSLKEVEYVKPYNIDFIICDHHNTGEKLPDAVAVLDAKRSDNTYPFNELSGCGVAFKFLQAYSIYKNNPDDKKLVMQMIDLVAVSTCADMVPLKDENRAILKYGLKKINENPLTCFDAIKKQMGISSRTINSTDIGFFIGPKINAAGRMEHGKYAVNLMISNDVNDCIKKADEIHEFNERRKKAGEDIYKEATKVVDMEPNAFATVVYGQDWAKGVLGIVASKLTEYCFRPTIVMNVEGDMLVGSCRSVGDFDLYTAIEKCSEYLEHFGGHKFAAGLSLKLENFEKFKEKFLKTVQEQITPEQKLQIIDYDLEIYLSDITPKLYSILQLFEPFGKNNEKPHFVTKDLVAIDDQTKLIGKNGNHVRFGLMDEAGNSIVGLSFFKPEFYDMVKDGKKFDAIYTIEENEFRGEKTLQIMISDIKMK